MTVTNTAGSPDNQQLRELPYALEYLDVKNTFRSRKNPELATLDVDNLKNTCRLDCRERKLTDYDRRAANRADNCAAIGGDLSERGVDGPRGLGGIGIGGYGRRGSAHNP